jgi:DNA-binding transcriptional MerR regulator
MQRGNTKPWRIGELAKAAGVSADTLRHYERKGVLCAHRSHNGYREYAEDALERVRIVHKALTVGFTLDELSAVFKVFDRGGAPCRQVRNMAAEKLAEIENHLKEVTKLRDDLLTALLDWDARLGKTASGQRAGLLNALAIRSSLGSSSTRLLLRKPTRIKKGKNR